MAESAGSVAASGEEAGLSARIESLVSQILAWVDEARDAVPPWLSDAWEVTTGWLAAIWSYVAFRAREFLAGDPLGWWFGLFDMPAWTEFGAYALPILLLLAIWLCRATFRLHLQD